MTELSISADEIRAAIEANVSTFAPENAREEVGRVVETGDGIARVEACTRPWPTNCWSSRAGCSAWR